MAMATSNSGTKAEHKCRLELTCTVCGNLYENPKTLDCLHTYCAKCLPKLVAQAINQEKSESSSESDNFKPACDHDLCKLKQLKTEDLDKLSPNHGYMNLVAQLNLQDTIVSGKETQCDDCEEDPAAVFCKECNIPLCKECKKHHMKAKTTRLHKLLSVEEIRSRSDSESFEGMASHVPWKCEKHKKLYVDVYCITCDVMICSYCAFTGHNLHEKAIATDLFENPGEGTDFKAQIEEKVDATRMVKTNFDKAIASIEEMRTGLSTSKESARNAVTVRHREIIEEVNRQKDELLSQVDTIFECKETILQQQLRELRAIENSIRESIKFADDNLAVGIPEEILFLKRKIESRMLQLTNNYKDYCLESEDNDIINFRKNGVFDLDRAIGTVSADPHVQRFTADEIDSLHLSPLETAEITVTCRDIVDNPLSESSLKLLVEIEPVGNGDAVGAVEGDAGEGGEREGGDAGEGGECEGGEVEGGEHEGDEGDEAGARIYDDVVATVESKKQGEYTVCITPKKSGEHRLTIGVMKHATQFRHICGSPFTITVYPKPARLDNPSEIIRDPAHLKSPWGVDANKEGLIVVSDVGNNCLVLFEKKDDDKYGYLRTIGKEGKGPLEFSSPRGVAFNPVNSQIVVAEKGNHRVQIVTSTGEGVCIIGQYGGAISQFHGPTDVAVNSEGVIFVTDSTNQRIQYFKSDGTFIGVFGQWGIDLGGVQDPYAITINGRGQVLVTERVGLRVHVFQKNDDDKYLGVFQFGQLGKENEYLTQPVGITNDPQNKHIFVSELDRQRVSVFSANGCYILSFGSQGPADNQFHNPMGLAVVQGQLIVADCANQRLSLFALK